MWLLPWEKLPPLVLGPLLTLVGLVSVVSGHRAGKEWMDLVWYFAALFGGIALTILGLLKWWREQDE
ncbi:MULTISPECIES: hypothetical protein [unclassified Duganella]|uniref:hypothetical protein n=1 Tax=unclassified Duganella TaxID=2636909 RepID=UPI0006FC5A36|nr:MULTISPECIES: hypothetical protein [unclassified Duganella]KQV59667.1 hypothetical protein ASD07_22830 [Duganella sp. Root336D2]KRB87149.1 hypothetical protein ASE26_07030 [Duganella sp. Root198D2]